MERLEAALAKAREMRQAAMSARPAVPGAHPADVAPGATDWMSVEEGHLDAERALRTRITALSGGRDAGPYDMLRSRALRQMKEKGWTRLAITSPGPACGKSTIALNLAFSLARQKDLRIMVVDLDLRRPALHKMLGETVTHSFWQALERTADFTSTARRYGDNLIVAMNNAPCTNPAELLQNGRTIEVLQELERQWKPDVIIFDMSPLMASDDNLGFLGNVDCALLIAAAESTSVSSIDVCEKELAGLTNVLGVVLNKCRYMDQDSNYNYSNY